MKSKQNSDDLKLPIYKWVIDISKGKGINVKNQKTRKQMKKEFFERKIKIK